MVIKQYKKKYVYIYKYLDVLLQLCCGFYYLTIIMLQYASVCRSWCTVTTLKNRNVEKSSKSVSGCIMVSQPLLSVRPYKKKSLYCELLRPSPHDTKANVIKMTYVHTQLYLFRVDELKRNYLTTYRHKNAEIISTFCVYAMKCNKYLVLIDHILSKTVLLFFWFCVLFSNLYPKIKSTAKYCLTFSISIVNWFWFWNFYLRKYFLKMSLLSFKYLISKQYSGNVRNKFNKGNLMKTCLQ